MVEATCEALYGAASTTSEPTADEYVAAEIKQQAQLDSFQEDFKQLQSCKLVLSTSQHVTLSPEDCLPGTNCVGGWLRRTSALGEGVIHQKEPNRTGVIHQKEPNKTGVIHLIEPYRTGPKKPYHPYPLV